MTLRPDEGGERGDLRHGCRQPGGPPLGGAALVLALALGTGAALSTAPLAAQQDISPRQATPLHHETATGRGEAAFPTARTGVRRGPIRIDGRLDEAAWRAAPAITHFVQGDPVEGASPAQPTEVRVLFDENAIYVGARLYESDPSEIRDQLVRRDQGGQFDFFEISLDPNQDRQTGYTFRVSAAGAEGDAFLFNDTDSDGAWNAVWDSGVHQDSLGWTAEMRIPLSQIRYESADSVQTWGVNFIRRRLASNSTSYFSLESRTVRGKVSQFGRLEGVEIRRRPRRLEIRPFAVSQLHTAPASPGNPLFDGSELGSRTGLDLSYGVGSAFSLDVTVNPDFGQVEVDPEVINLTAFETFFPEKRPFFVQDARVFDFRLSGRQSQLLFSRRIGRRPHGSGPAGADFTDVPSETTILGAAKLTGRTDGGLTLGAIAAVTDAESGRGYFADTDRTQETLVEPRAEYGVLRLRQDFRDGASRIGLLATGMKRQLPGDGSFDFLTSDAYSAGIDFEHNWGGERNRDWRVFGFMARSLVKGPAEALLGIQTNSNHYFQRPDAPDLAVDSTAISLKGANWRVQFERQSAEHWTWATWLGEITPGFEINDLGFSRDGERLDVGGRVTYRQIRPTGMFRNYRINFFSFHNWRHTLLDNFFSARNWAHAYKAGMFSLSGNFEFLNNWGLELASRISPTALSDTQTRGGPLMTRPASLNLRWRLNTDRRAAFSAGPSIEYTRRMRGAGEILQAGLDLTLRPSPSWEIGFQPAFRRERDAAQFVASTDAVTFDPTFGKRYLFSDLLRRTFSMETRVNVTFTPDLSLQVFAQPLVSSGDFQAYKQLARPESFEFLRFAEGTANVAADGSVTCVGGATCVAAGKRYVDFDGQGAADFSFSDRDFNIRSLRGNAVLRWEYRSGSTLFLVWQQSRREDLNSGRFDLGSDLGGVFGAPAENTFILKLSHYLSF